MMNKKRGLGRGLDALIGAAGLGRAENPPANESQTDARSLPVDLMQRGRYQPRRDFNTEALEELASSIRAQGMIQPIVVRPLEGGRFELEHVNFDLHDLIQGLGAVLQTRANEKGLTGGVDIGANCPRFVTGDAARLRQVLLSLIDSALKFTAHGSVRLHANATEIDGRPVLRFDVTDTGVGLSKAVQDRLFQPYVQVDSRVAGQKVATGLGLSIAQKLARLMGGELGCQSVVGQGSLYWFILPVEHARVSAPVPQPDREPSQPGSLAGHVLVVEEALPGDVHADPGGERKPVAEARIDRVFEMGMAVDEAGDDHASLEALARAELGGGADCGDRPVVGDRDGPIGDRLALDRDEPIGGEQPHSASASAAERSQRRSITTESQMESS